MSELPVHVTERTEVTTKYLCHHCASRIILSDIHEHPDREQSLVDWLARHRHGVEEPQ